MTTCDIKGNHERLVKCYVLCRTCWSLELVQRFRVSFILRSPVVSPGRRSIFSSAALVSTPPPKAPQRSDNGVTVLESEPDGRTPAEVFKCVCLSRNLDTCSTWLTWKVWTPTRWWTAANCTERRPTSLSASRWAPLRTLEAKCFFCFCRHNVEDSGGGSMQFWLG